MNDIDTLKNWLEALKPMLRHTRDAAESEADKSLRSAMTAADNSCKGNKDIARREYFHSEWHAQRAAESFKEYADGMHIFNEIRDRIEILEEENEGIAP